MISAVSKALLRDPSGQSARRQATLRYIALLLLVTGASCRSDRPDRVPVSGQVQIDGRPLTAGTITFVPENARASSGKIDTQGRFELMCYDGQDGAVLGRHRVAVSAIEGTSEEQQRWLAPQKYASHTTSGLEVEITGPTDSVRIELTSGGN